jgi:peptidoglycan/xylan/chitin deacetylase (PgdA/CDA1 family)
MTCAVPILTYHHVNPLEGDMVTISVDHFEDQMAFLRRRGYHTLFISELVEWMEGKKMLPKKSVALTFDDGFWDNYTYAFPVLKKYNLKATIFIVTGWVSQGNGTDLARKVIPHQQGNQLAASGEGRQISMTWGEVKALQDSGLIEIESHTHSHNKELHMDKPALLEDLRYSRQAIFDHLNKESTCLCWPGGRYNPESVQAAREAGFKALCTTKRGLNQLGGNPLELKRVTVPDSGYPWLRKTIFLFSHTLSGKLYAKIKPV